MCKFTITIVALFLCILLPTQTHADSNAKNNTGALTISVISLDIDDEALDLVYEIRNDSEDDAWILVGWCKRSDSTFGMGASARIAEDGHTLTIRGRFKGKTPGMGIPPSYGRFVRLRPGDSQTESIFMRLPAYPAPQSGRAGQQEQVIKYATCLAVELGYYRGNVPERMLGRLRPPDNVFPVDPHNPAVSPVGFNWRHEYVNSRDDEFLTIEDFREFEGEEEQVIRTVIENLNIPYEQKRDYTRKIKSPGLHSYEKIEIQYKPSILEFFFPYKSQQSLLSPDEMEYLQSDKTIVLNNKQDIHTVAHFIPHTRADTTVLVGLPVRYRSHGEVVCYSEGNPFLSFFIYNDNAIVIDGYRLLSFEGFPSLKKLTPQIQAIDLRTRCAANLKIHWYRFRFYNMREAIRQNDPSIRDQTLYPTPFEWCDDMLRPYYDSGGITAGVMTPKPHICPGAGEGKNHYSLNPNCKPDSPSDIVLLFETKAGWNQHGGPELFTFDNHDPKGGCVLLNDGTVKFIRTTEQLRQLRWE
ncbi:MAG: hypothetical protein ACYSWO_06770 [Planctomycetota bacterium]|jgi:hypothetical protein